jgi:hypothetical protein
MAHHLAVVPQVVVTHPIAALTPVVHLLHVEILPVQVPVRHPIAANELMVHAIPDQVLIVQQVVLTVTATRVQVPVQVQIVPIAHPVHMVIDQNVAMIVVHQVIVHPVLTVTEIHVHLQDHLPIAANAVMVHVIPVHLVIDQQVVHTATEIPAQVPVHLQIAANALTVHATHVQALIVRRVLTATDQNVAMIDAQQVTAQPVAPTETAIHDRLHVLVPIVHPVHTVID